jgi:FKBP-type peptidyl-prolyl cis-trans isomerase
MDQTAINACKSQAGRTTLPVVLGLLAIATAIPAWVLPAIATPVAASSSTEGKVLGRAGVGAESITGMRVVSWDDALSASRVFEVKRDGERWIIQSNYGYPADGNTRVTRTATGILGVTLGRQVTDKIAEHAALGVVDPLEPEAGAKTGYGKRVTMTDSTGATALDVIIGNRADNSGGVNYVREVGKNEVYTAKVDNDISTKFVDYVETDPFKIQKDSVRGIAVVAYTLDPDKGLIQPGPYTKATRAGTDKTWESIQTPEDKRIATTKVDEVLSELAAVRLQGVRPFNLRWLQTHGFYLANDPQSFKLPNALTVQLQDKPYALFGTEGRLDVTTNDGLRYSFMFGKVALSDDEDKEEQADKKDEKKDGKPADSSNRYVAVFVTYDASLDEVAKTEAAAKPDAPKAKKISGKERADKAQARFQRFFYVISDANFKKLHPDVSTWWDDKPKEPMAGNSGKTVKQWLEDNAKLPGISTTPSGLQFQILESGPADGPKPTTADQVKVAYKGTLIDGTQFDANEDMQFGVTGVIKGWTEALQLMKPGDKLKLFVPPELGYGETGSPPKIGPSQILIFEVTLKEVVGKTAAPAVPAEDKAAPVAPAAEVKAAPADAPAK